MSVYEVTLPTMLYIRLDPLASVEAASIRNRGPLDPFLSMPPMSICYDCEDTVGDFVGLVSYWAIGTTNGFPSPYGYGALPASINNVLAPVNDGLSDWVAYRISGHTEVYRGSNYAIRQWNQRPCGGTNEICDKGDNIRNVMMFDESQPTSNNGIFPFRPPNSPGYIPSDGPAGSNLAAGYFAAIFYDIANEAGLGLHKADLLYWKTVSLITDSNNPKNGS